MKLGMVVLGCSSSTWQVKAGRSGVEVHPLLPGEFKTSPGYMRVSPVPSKINIQIT